MFYETPDITVCPNTTTCLKRTKLVSYYNELVLQLRIAEHFVNTSISREIKERHRINAEKKQKKIIKLLHENILPHLDIVVSTVSLAYSCITI